MVRRTLWHDQEGTPKGGRYREVPLSKDAMATLQAHWHLRGPYVFCEPAGTDHDRNLGLREKEPPESIDWPEPGPHLRRCLCTRPGPTY